MTKQLNMQKKMQTLQSEAVKEFGEDADVLIATMKNGHCGAIIHGAAVNVAHSIFALIHGAEDGCGADLYQIVKLLTLNILHNESPYAVDLMNSILNATDTPQQIEKPSGKKAVIIDLHPKKNEQN